NESNGLTQELLSLVTSLAHYLKVLTRVALKGALKAQTEYKCPSSIKGLLSRLTETSDRQKWGLFRLSYQETDITSDLCTSCKGPVESECIEHTRKRKRWHLYCFVCSSCNHEIQHVYPQSAYDEAAGILFCPACAEKRSVSPGGFKFVSQLEQYSFLMRVALKRLYGLLKMKNALEHPNMARYRKIDGKSSSHSLADKTQTERQKFPKSVVADTDAVQATKEAANKEFDAALENMDTLDLKPKQLQKTSTLQSHSDVAMGDHAAAQGTEQRSASIGLQVSTDAADAQRKTSNTSTAGDVSSTIPPLSPEIVSSVANAAVEEAKNSGAIVQMREPDADTQPPQVMADRRKPRVAHTTVHTMKARMENRGVPGDFDTTTSSPPTFTPSQQQQQPARRVGHIVGQAVQVTALSPQAGTRGGIAVPLVDSSPAIARKLSKPVQQPDDSDAVAASKEADTATKVKSMLTRAHTMHYISDLNTAEIFCAKHVAVARLAALLGGHSEFSQADLVALIGASKKASGTGGGAGMWSRLKTNLKKKDGSASNNSGSGGKDRMRNATFGVALEALMERQGVETDLGSRGKQKLHIPQFFEQVLKTLSSMDMAVEGIFRKNGNIRRLREVTEAVDRDYARVDLRKDTPVQIAALLKKFLRELPDPLIPFRMRRLFLAIAAISSPHDRFEGFRYAILLLPQANRDMLNVLITFLNWVATFSHVDEQSGSKMDVLNLATVITPNILYADVKEPTRDRDDTFSYEACNVIQQFMEAKESLWQLPDAVIAFLRDNSSELAEGVSELNTKELLRRCERQIQQQGASRKQRLATQPYGLHRAAHGIFGSGMRCLSTVALEFAHTKAESPSTKEPLVILHGLFGSKQNWRAISKQLSRTLNRDTYSVDLRNHGDSPHVAPHSYECMSADIARFIEDHGLGQAILVGHSMGGKVVMRTALDRPDLVSQLVVDDMAPVQIKLAHDFASYVTKLSEIEQLNVTSQKVADQMLAEVEPDISVRQFLLTNMKKVKDPEAEGGGVKGAYKSRIPLDLLGKSLAGMMAWEVDPSLTYSGPTLFIAGKRSPYIKPYAFPAISQHFPNFEVSELDTGHWVHAEMPSEFMELVEAFVAKHE
ncbi:Rho-type GTPase activating protein Rga1, partial [Dipsacomyces acuminosporus]